MIIAVRRIGQQDVETRQIVVADVLVESAHAVRDAGEAQFPEQGRAAARTEVGIVDPQALLSALDGLAARPRQGPCEDAQR